MIDHIDILKDGASAVYGSDAITGVVNFFLLHKFRGLEIGGSYGNTNLGASNDMGEWEAWIKAGTGDDKTDIVVIADFWEHAGGLFSRDRDLSANAFYIPCGGFETRSVDEPGSVGGSWLPACSRKCFSARAVLPQFGVNTPLPHSGAKCGRLLHFIRTHLWLIPMHIQARLGIHQSKIAILSQIGTDYKGGGDYFFYNFAAVTPALPPADRQSFYGSFTRDLCDKYLTVFADFKYVRSFFDASARSCAVYARPIQDPRH